MAESGESLPDYLALIGTENSLHLHAIILVGLGGGMYRRMLAWAALALPLLVPGTLSATLIVDPPQQITKQVTVQLVQTALDNGTSPATVFGNATQRADIEAGIDAIWAQAGIDIKI